MARPYIEFIQSQSLPWVAPAPATLPEGARWKQLSADDATGEVTALVQLPSGWMLSAPSHAPVGLELFVLAGSFIVNGVAYGLHDYAFLPAGHPLRAGRSESGATLMVYFHGRPALVPGEAPAGLYDPALLIERTVTRLQPWDNSNVDPKIDHLHAHRKNLRLDPNGSCRTYLLGGLPHGFSPTGTAHKETHPHVEEFFMVSGAMSCTLVGTLRPGAYFWRPPGIAHGLDSSLTGFLLLCRTPGTNKTVSVWDAAALPINDNPPYNPVLPPALAALNPRELADTLTY
jgi:hypothetical protein